MKRAVFGPRIRPIASLVAAFTVTWTSDFGAVRPSAAQTPPDAGGVRVEVGVEPAEVTVGQPFRSVLRVTAPAGVTVEYTELAVSDSLQPVQPLEVLSTADGSRAAVYTLAAWATGDSLRAAVPVRLFDAAGQVRVQTVRLRLPIVRSVLPAADTIVPPQSPRGLYVPPAFGERSWWWLLAVLLAGLTAGLLGYWLLSRRRRLEDGTATVAPRTWALLQLDQVRRELAGGPDAIAGTYQRVSWVVRSYLCRVEPTWGLDLTTTELLDRLRFGHLEGDSVAALQHLLDSADRVKFAQSQPTGEEAKQLILDARSWIKAFPADGGPGQVPERAA